MSIHLSRWNEIRQSYVISQIFRIESTMQDYIATFQRPFSNLADQLKVY